MSCAPARPSLLTLGYGADPQTHNLALNPKTCPQTQPWGLTVLPNRALGVGLPHNQSRAEMPQALRAHGGAGVSCATPRPSLLTRGYGADVQTHNLSWVWGCPITKVELKCLELSELMEEQG